MRNTRLPNATATTYEPNVARGAGNPAASMLRYGYQIMPQDVAAIISPKMGVNAKGARPGVAGGDADGCDKISPFVTARGGRTVYICVPTGFSN